MVIQKNGELKIKAEQIIDEAYNRGKNDAKREISLSGAYERAYQRGLDDLHNALIAIDKWDNEHKNLIFHGSLGTVNILKNHTSDYIVSEVRKWQQEQARQAQADVTDNNDGNMTLDEAIAILEAYEKKDAEKRFCNYIQKPCPYEIECDDCEVYCSYDRACKRSEGKND